MSELVVDSGVLINNQNTVTVNDLDEDTDSLAEDEDQDIIGLGDEHEQIQTAGVERTIATSLPVKKNDDDDDDFRPVKKRKVQENNEGAEVDEVVKLFNIQ